jgi:hypothetical protein
MLEAIHQYMLTNIQRIRVYALSIIVGIIILAIFFGVSDHQRLADIRTLGQARSFSYALEVYRQDFWRYPVGNRIDVRKGVVLSENGLVPGTKLYYRGGIPSSRAVTYEGKDTTYSINFTLHKLWPEQGITSTKCTITENYVLKCKK